ncbi:MAG: hypothetical protein J6X07_05090 [Prevotella sp.]|nr:hypothetical protein [Prevotella sp.]
MTYRNRYALIFTILLTAWLVGSNAMAQSSGEEESSTGVVVRGNVYGGGNIGYVGTFNTSEDGRDYYWQKLKETDTQETGVCTVTITDAKANIIGHVFGAGKGEATTFKCEPAMVRTASVTISNGTVQKNVYGGGEVGRVDQDSEVTVGVENTENEPYIKGSVFGAGAGEETHGYSALVRGSTQVIIQGKAKVGQSVYGGGMIASVGKYGLDKYQMPSVLQGGGICTILIRDQAKIGADGEGNVFGAGKGVTPHYYYQEVYQEGEVNKNSKRMVVHKDYDQTTNTGHNPEDEHKKWDYYTDRNFVWEYFTTPEAYATYLETLALATKPDVTITESATVNGSVFGGGEMGLTKGSVDVKISGGTITKDVYGGGALANTNITNWDANGYEDVTELLTPGTSIVTGYYTRSGTGTENDPYEYTLIETANQKAVADIDYFRKGTWATGQDGEGHDIYTAPTANTQAITFYKTNVILTGGAIGGNVYGGGLGQKADPDDATVKAIEAKVYGDVLVKLNEDTDNDNCKVKGSIFGCNNLNGSPQNTVTVHVYKTVGYDDTHKKSSSKDGSTFDVEAVYGGGNLAAYEPVNANGDATAKAQTHTTVIIDGCDLTSIKQVYGGGNAASTPATDVTINGTYEIDEVFGGGNGKDKITVNGVKMDNPGANVGFFDYSAVEAQFPTKEDRQTTAFIADYVYGSGAANVNILGGTIHRVFGGSNTKGNVRVTAVTMLEEVNDDTGVPCCAFNVDEAYGGGKSAPMDAEAKLLMSCIPGLKEAYGGAEEADIIANVELTITNGTFDRVFGGNNLSGTISGSIKVNIEETGCKPIIIGELYGGGNEAGYSIYGYKQVTTGTGDEAVTTLKPRTSATDGTAVNGWTTAFADPVMNIKSFTSIGNVYGGGYGETAVMVGSPTVNINVVADGTTEAQTKPSETVTVTDPVTGDETTETHYYSDYAENTKTIGGHSVTLPSHTKGKMGAIQNVFGGGNAAKVIGSTTVNIGTKATEDYVSNFKNESTPRTGLTVVGADIRGNVYGGGNEAEVTGSTNVNIGKKATE